MFLPRPPLVAGFVIVCHSEPEPAQSQHTATYTVGVATIEATKQVAPGESFDLVGTVENTGDTEWGTETTFLDYVGDEEAGGADLLLSAATAPGETGTFSGTITAPTDEGDYELVWQPIIEGHEIGTPLTLLLSVGTGGDDTGKSDDSGA